MPATVELDPTDHEIIESLREDARRTYADIAARVSLSAPAVKRRIDRLTTLGVILGYTIKVDYAKLGRPLEALIELTFSGTTTVDDQIATLARIPEVDAIFAITDDWDALVRVRVDDIAHVKQVLNEMRRSDGVTGTKTVVVLDTWSRR
jgi:Lrp/AsnC family transcriptional regulator, leucine-responsive regulatory protein